MYIKLDVNFPNNRTFEKNILISSMDFPIVREIRYIKHR